MLSAVATQGSKTMCSFTKEIPSKSSASRGDHGYSSLCKLITNCTGISGVAFLDLIREYSNRSTSSRVRTIF